MQYCTASALCTSSLRVPVVCTVSAWRIVLRKVLVRCRTNFSRSKRIHKSLKIEDLGIAKSSSLLFDAWSRNSRLSLLLRTPPHFSLSLSPACPAFWLHRLHSCMAPSEWPSLTLQYLCWQATLLRLGMFVWYLSPARAWLQWLGLTVLLGCNADRSLYRSYLPAPQ